MKKYDSYKDSGIEWIGEIPSHWNEIRMRFIGQLYGGLSGKSANDFNQRGNENNKHFIPFTNIAGNLKIKPDEMQTVVIDDGEKQNRVKTGDLFFLMSSEDYDDVGKSSVLTADLNEDTYLNSFCKGFRITNDNIEPEYLNYHLHSKQVRHNLLVEANGFTRINLKIGKVQDLLIALPPKQEQTTIAHYLDRKTTEIDQLIAHKKRLLTLYEEEKTALINQAVTKGLDSKAKMKDSGIEWLGMIPQHWEVVPIKYSLLVPLTDGPHETPSLYQEGVPFISAEAIKDDKIDFTKMRGYISQEDHNRYSKKYKPQKGDVYMIKSGATTGNLARVETDVEFNIWSPLAAFRPDPKNTTTDFLFYYMKSESFFTAVKLGWNYGTQQNIGMNVLENLRMVRPPFEEQQSIVHHIETECSRIDTKVARTEKLINLLKEYRTALISEVVTGKVKVV